MGNFVDSDCASQPSLHTRVAIKYRIPESGYPMPKTEGVTRAMQANKAKDSRPELLLRKALWAAGIRGYRLHAKHLPGKPDLVFLTRWLAIFAHILAQLSSLRHRPAPPQCLVLEREAGRQQPLRRPQRRTAARAGLTPRPFSQRRATKSLASVWLAPK